MTKGASSLLHYILRRIDHDSPPIYLTDNELEGFPASELDFLVHCGVIKKRAELKWVTNPEDPKDRRSVIKRFIEVSVVGLAAVLKSQNAVDGEPWEHGDQLFGLGDKIVDGVGEVAIYLAVRNGNESEFIEVCERVTQAQKPRPTAVLVPQPVPLTTDAQKFLRSRQVVVIPLIKNLVFCVWALDWKRLLQRLAPPILRLISSTGQVFYKSHEITLSNTPFKFLRAIAESAPNPVPRATLLEIVLGKDCDVNPVQWTRDNKGKITQAFGKAGFPGDETHDLLIPRSGSYRLNLDPDRIEIV